MAKEQGRWVTVHGTHVFIQGAGARKEPHEMTRQDFRNEFWFHGEHPASEHFGSSVIHGGVARDHRLAAGYAGLYAGEAGGRLRLVRDSEISPTAKASRATPSGDLLVTLMPDSTPPGKGSRVFYRAGRSPFCVFVRR